MTAGLRQNYVSVRALVPPNYHAKISIPWVADASRHGMLSAEEASRWHEAATAG
jgi:hypothetical protein